MILDGHVHVCAFTLPRGSMSPTVERSLAFRFMRWRLGVSGTDARADRELEARLVETIEQARPLDAAVVLAFDAVYARDGQRDEANTHLYVANDYVIELARRHPRVLFGASVHPYRRDAVAEIERCAAAGAALLKWLPIVQNFDPADERCTPVYEALAHLGLPLLSHTGGERSLPILNPAVANPMLLEPALKRGVTVIAAHCGTRSKPGEPDYLPQFMQLAREYAHCYGDTAALSLPTRSYAYRTLLADEAIRRKLVHGSDWPIPSLPMLRLGPGQVARLLGEGNWMRRDVLIKQQLGFDEDYWHRAATILRMPPGTESKSAFPSAPSEPTV